MAPAPRLARKVASLASAFPSTTSPFLTSDFCHPYCHCCHHHPPGDAARWLLLGTRLLAPGEPGRRCECKAARVYGCVYTAHTRPMCPPHMLMHQCMHTVRCAHIGLCTHTHTHTPQNTETYIFTSKQTCMVMRSTQTHSTSTETQ